MRLEIASPGCRDFQSRKINNGWIFGIRRIRQRRTIVRLYT